MVSYLSIFFAVTAILRSAALPVAYYHHGPLLGNGIGGTIVTGPVAAAGDLLGVAGLVAVGGGGASGHIGRSLGAESKRLVLVPEVGPLLGHSLDYNGIGGTVGTGNIAAVGSIPNVADGLVSIAGVGGNGHIGRSEEISRRSPSILHNGIGGIIGTGPVVGAGAIPGLASGIIAVGDIGAAGHIGRSEDGVLHSLNHNGIGGTVGTGNTNAAGVLNHIAAGAIEVNGAGASGHLG